MAFVRAARKDEIPAGSIREFQVDGLTVAIANIGNKFYAINNTCLHRGGPLGQGELHGVAVTCPWHGWQYDVTTVGPRIDVVRQLPDCVVPRSVGRLSVNVMQPRPGRERHWADRHRQSALVAIVQPGVVV